MNRNAKVVEKFLECRDQKREALIGKREDPRALGRFRAIPLNKKYNRRGER